MNVNALSQHLYIKSGFQEGDEYTSNPYDRFDDWQFTTTFIDFTGEFELAGVEHNLLVGANYLDYYYGQLRTKNKSDSFKYSAGQAEPMRVLTLAMQQTIAYTPANMTITVSIFKT